MAGLEPFKTTTWSADIQAQLDRVSKRLALEQQRGDLLRAQNELLRAQVAKTLPGGLPRVSSVRSGAAPVDGSARGASAKKPSSSFALGGSPSMKVDSTLRTVVMAAAFEQRAVGEVVGEAEDDMPTVELPLAQESVISKGLADLLRTREYLDPDKGGTSHPLYYWVRKCRSSLKGHRLAEAQLYLERVERGVAASEKEIRSAFARFDPDGSGKLDSNEFKYMCGYLGLGQEEALLIDSNKDDVITAEEFQNYVGALGGLRNLLERRRERVHMSQWGVHAQPSIRAGSRVQAHFYVKGKKSCSWKEAHVLAKNVKNQCPDAKDDGVLLLFGYGADSDGVGNWKARQVVPPTWIVSSAEDAATCEALREVGILDEQQAFWSSVFPDSELRAVGKLQNCQRVALRNVREQATINHEKAMPEVLKKFTGLGYGERELQAVLTWVQDLAPAVIHIHIDKIGRFLEVDDHYRNQFETHTSCGALDDGNAIRTGWEKTLFGEAYDGAKGFDRCKYGALGVMNDYRGVTSAMQYGDSYLVLKDVRLRCTFAPTDSGGMESNKLAVLDKYAHVLLDYNEAETKGIVDVAMAAYDLENNPTIVPQLLRGPVCDARREWVTLGFPALAQRSGCLYFEVRLEEGCRAPQVGLVSSSFEIRPWVADVKGVGDDKNSWSVDGQHCALWHDGHLHTWSQTWPAKGVNEGLGESVVVGVAMDLDARRWWFSTNGAFDDAPTFDEGAIPAGLSVYPAISLRGMAVFNFGPTFKHEPPNAKGSFGRWPNAPEGHVPVATKLVGNSDIVSMYKEIQIHGEVNLNEHVQRLVANKKYMNTPKAERTWALTVDGLDDCSGIYNRAGSRDGMTFYRAENGCSIYWHAASKGWRISTSENSEDFLASAPARTDGILAPPRKGWQIPDALQGIVDPMVFQRALLEGGVKREDLDRLVGVLGGEDKGKDVVFKVRGDASFSEEWKKIPNPPMDAADAWSMVVKEAQNKLVKDEVMTSAEVVASGLYPGKEHKWTKNVTLRGVRDQLVRFASKTSTLDRGTTLTIETGPLRDGTAGVGARVVVQAPGDNSYCNWTIRGSIGAKVKEPNTSSWTVVLDTIDLQQARPYAPMLKRDKGEDDVKNDGKDDGKGETRNEKQEQKISSEKKEYTCVCPEEFKSIKVSYKEGTKIGDEISGFSFDKDSLLTPISISGFSKPGPAQAQGVQTGWYLHTGELFGNSYLISYKLGELVGEGEDEALKTFPGDLSSVFENESTFLKQLEKIRDISDLELTFTNGLSAKLLPSVHVTFGPNDKVGDEIKEFTVTQQKIVINSFVEDSEGKAQEETPEAEPKEKTEPKPKESPEAEAEGEVKAKVETVEVRKNPKIAYAAGARIGWQLNFDSTFAERNRKDAPAASQEELLKNPAPLREMSGVTLVFEPLMANLFEGYGYRNTDEDASRWPDVHIPAGSATFTFTCDGDTRGDSRNRWGVFALVVPAGPNPPTQECVDALAEKWIKLHAEVQGRTPDALCIEQNDWDEERLRALCKLRGWEFEWMTEDGERQRRVGERADRMTKSETAVGTAESKPGVEELPDGYEASARSP